MRLIRLATVALARIVGLKASGLYQDALMVIDQVLEQVFGLRPELVRNMDESSLLESLTNIDGLDTDRLYLGAELFHEEAEIFTALGQPEEASWRYQRALSFYLEVVLNGGAVNFPEPHEKIQNLVNLLQNKIPPKVSLLLFEYYEQVGKVVLAERTLEWMREAGAAGEDINDLRSGLYQRLLEKPDSDLALLGQSRASLESKLASSSLDFSS